MAGGTESSEIRKIRDIAFKMRAAIESSSPHSRPDSMKDFPTFDAGESALLLGAYLVDCGICGFVRVSGRRGTHSSYERPAHFWLARGDLVVDIAADGYTWDNTEPVVVSESSSWHQRFELEEDFTPADFRKWGRFNMEKHHWFYEHLQKVLPAAGDYS